MRTIIVSAILLISWKIVRTDWIVICPWKTIGWSFLSSTNEPFNRIYRPPVSPAWKPPQPSSLGVRSWHDLFDGDSGSIPNGNPTVSPDLVSISWKIGIPLLLMIFYRFRRLLMRIGRMSGLSRESKKQNKSDMATPMDASD